MKQILLFSLIVLFSESHSYGQSLAFNEITFLKNNQNNYGKAYDSSAQIYRYHKNGYGGMIVGGSMVGVGGILLCIGLAGDPQHFNGPEFLGAFIAGVGINLFLISNIVSLCSGDNSGHWRKHYSVRGNKHGVGLAYNF